jgi:hypothetical protein
VSPAPSPGTRPPICHGELETTGKLYPWQLLIVEVVVELQWIPHRPTQKGVSPSYTLLLPHIVDRSPPSSLAPRAYGPEQQPLVHSSAPCLAAFPSTPSVSLKSCSIGEAVDTDLGCV